VLLPDHDPLHVLSVAAVVSSRYCCSTVTEKQEVSPLFAHLHDQ